MLCCILGVLIALATQCANLRKKKWFDVDSQDGSCMIKIYTVGYYYSVILNVTFLIGFIIALAEFNFGEGNTNYSASEICIF